MHNRVHKGTVRSFPHPLANHVMRVILGGGAAYLPARPHGRKEAPTFRARRANMPRPISSRRQRGVRGRFLAVPKAAYCDRTGNARICLSYRRFESIPLNVLPGRAGAGRGLIIRWSRGRVPPAPRQSVSLRRNRYFGRSLILRGWGSRPWLSKGNPTAGGLACKAGVALTGPTSCMFGDPRGGESLRRRDALSHTGSDGLLEFAPHQRDFDLHAHGVAQLRAVARGRQPRFRTA